MMTITKGTRVLSIQGECDEGVMSGDPTDTPVERRTGPGAVGTITRVDERKSGTVYHVEFSPSEVWVCLEPEELADPTQYQIL
jgi:hypothetical protein